MSQRPVPFACATLLALIGGAALGAATVALTTPRTGREVRDRFRVLANRIRGRVGRHGRSDDEAVEMLFI